MRQMVATVLVTCGVASFRGSATIKGSSFWWQCYYRGEWQMVAMQWKELIKVIILLSN